MIPTLCLQIATVDKYQGQQNDYILLSLVRTRAVGHIRDVRRLVVAMSRARLGLYIFGRAELFANCYELRPAMKQLLARPQQLHLHPSERVAVSLLCRFWPGHSMPCQSTPCHSFITLCVFLVEAWVSVAQARVSVCIVSAAWSCATLCRFEEVCQELCRNAYACLNRPACVHIRPDCCTSPPKVAHPMVVLFSVYW